MAHSAANQSLHAQFKARYADRIGVYLSANDILQERFPFRSKARLGDTYDMPILTQRVAGGKYALAQAGNITFGDIKTSVIKKAQLRGTQLFMSNALDWEAAFTSDNTGARSWSDEFDLVINDLWDSARFRLEMNFLWGQHPGGSIGTVDGAPAANVITILAAELAPGILYQLIGAEVDIWSADLDTKRAGVGADGQYTITAVDPEAGTITVDDDQNVATTDVIFFMGERTVGTPDVFANGAGLMVWARNTGSIAGLSAATDIVWKPSTVAVGSAALQFDHILEAAKRVQARGHKGKLCALLSLESWNDSMNDLSATVRRDPSDRKYALGAESIVFYTGTGEVEVVAHPYMKKGYSVLFPVMTPNADGSYRKEQIDKSPICRIGATDLAFVGPDGSPDSKGRQSYFEKIQRTNLLSVDVYSHQALFVHVPSRLVAFTGVVPGTV